MSEKIVGESRNSEGFLFEMDLLGPDSAVDHTVSPPKDNRTVVNKVVEVVGKFIGTYYCREFVQSITIGNPIVPKLLRAHINFPYVVTTRFGSHPAIEDPAFMTHLNFERCSADDYSIVSFEEMGVPSEYEKEVKNTLSQTNFAKGGTAADYLADLVLSYLSPIFSKQQLDQIKE